MDSIEDKFLRAYTAIQDDLRAYVHAIVRHAAAEDDVLQEVALVLWRKWPSYDPSRAPFGAWARGIASTEILRLRRRRARQPALLDEAAIAAIDAAWDRHPVQDPHLEALEHCLEGLDPRQRRLLELRYREDLELEAIAARIDRGAEAVGKALQRLRLALADCVRRRLVAS